MSLTRRSLLRSLPLTGLASAFNIRAQEAKPLWATGNPAIDKPREIAIQLLNPGGVLLTFSCSGLMTTDLFQKIIADAAIDAGRDVQFIEQFRQAADHPVIATYPEGLYLKGFACRVM